MRKIVVILSRNNNGEPKLIIMPKTLGSFAMDEVQQGKKSLKMSKAPGYNQIPTKLFLFL